MSPKEDPLKMLKEIGSGLAQFISTLNPRNKGIYEFLITREGVINNQGCEQKFQKNKK